MSLKLGLNLRWPPHQCLRTAMAYVTMVQKEQDSAFQSQHFCLVAQQKSATHLGNFPGGLDKHAQFITCINHSIYIFLWFCITQSDRGHPKFRAGLHVEPQLVVKNCSSSIFHHESSKQSSIPMVTVSLYLFKTSK